MDGWMGTILRVNLSSGKIEKELLSDELRLNYIGGRGINSRILYKEVKPGVDALSGDNVLIFGTGSLVGTIAPSSGRMTITAKSPLTGILGDSNVGGHFSLELKRAGFDHIILTGKAERPVYLWIDDDHVELKPADHLWGRTTSETEDIIRRELGDGAVKIASIGPGGENLVRYACVICNTFDAAGRTGMGAVMGSKNLKAVAVRGTKGIKVARPDAFMELTLRLQERIVNAPIYKGLTEYGTPVFAGWLSSRGAASAQNGQTNVWPDFAKVDARTLKREYYVGQWACSTNCARHCKHAWAVKKGPYAGIRGGCIEWATIASFGYGCLISDPAVLLKVTNLCDDYGLDVMDMGSAVAAAMEWYEKGLVTKKETDGVDLRWGDGEVVIEMIHKVAKKEGFGDLLAEGAARAAKRIGWGADKYVAHSKGMGFGVGDDIRFWKGYALNMATSTRGGCHLRGMPGHETAGEVMKTPPEILEKKFGTAEAGDPSSYNKASLVVYHQNLCALADSLQICKFVTEWDGEAVDIRDLADLFSLATGIEMDEKTITEAANRIYTVERAFLVREGITRKDDILAGRWGSEPIPDGPLKGERIDPDKFNKLLEEYYKLRGWDSMGIPIAANLLSLGLKDVAEELKKTRAEAG